VEVANLLARIDLGRAPHRRPARGVRQQVLPDREGAVRLVEEVPAEAEGGGGVAQPVTSLERVEGATGAKLRDGLVTKPSQNSESSLCRGALERE